MTLLIDNYDSFSYNLYQLTGELNPDIRVIRNDELSVEEIRALKPDRIILSPGPGVPKTQASQCRSQRNSGKKSRCWAFASDIRPSAPPSEQRSPTPKR